MLTDRKVQVFDMDFAQKMQFLSQATVEQLQDLTRAWPGCPRWPLSHRRMQLGLEKALPSRLAARAYPLAHCLKQLEQAHHPRLQQVWLAILQQTHPQGAIQELIRLLASAQDPLAEGVAWGLARFGRQILPDLKERWPGAWLRMRERICQVLWYLGPRAAPCLGWMGKQGGEWALAAYYAMGEAGWPALLALRRRPLPMPRECLDALAQMALGFEQEERHYAVQCLGDPQPGYLKERTALLQALTEDEDPRVVEQALLALRRGSLPIPARAICAALVSPDGDLRKAATEILWASRGDGGEAIAELGDYLVALPESQLTRVLEKIEVSGETLDCLLPLLRSPDWRTRRAALQAFLRLGGKPQVIEFLLQDAEVSVARHAAEALLQRRVYEPVMKELHRPGVLAAVGTSFFLLQLLHEKGPAAVEPWLRGLDWVDHSPDQAKKIRDQLSLESIRWDRWPHFNDVQRKTALALMSLHRRVPPELMEELRRGQLCEPALLEAVFQNLSPGQLESLMEDCPEWAGRVPHFRGPDRATWDLLLTRVKDSSEAARTLSAWLHNPLTHPWLEELEPAFCEGLEEGEARQTLEGAIAREVLTWLEDPPSQRRQQWALYLVHRPGAGHHALRYLHRWAEEIPTESLRAAWQRVLREAPYPIRMLALTLLKTSPDWLHPLAEQMGPDPDPVVEARRLVIVARLGGGTTRVPLENDEAQADETGPSADRGEHTGGLSPDSP